MKNSYKYLMLLGYIFFFISSASAQNKTIEQFSFLLGNWEMKTDKGKITEHWQKHQDSLIGQSYRHNSNGGRILMENLVIKKVDGDFYYCPKVNGQNNNETVCFKLISTKENTFVFENLAHDFPQRIVYQNQKARTLLAWIEGEKNGKKGRSEFKYQRIE